MKLLLLIFASAALLYTKNSFAQETQASDTASIKGKCVVFWEPEPSWFDSSSAEEGSDLEILSDFRYYTGKIIPFLKKKNTRYKRTSQNVLRIVMNSGESRFFRKTDAGSLVAIVLTDGTKPPLILPGVITDTDFFLEFRNFFEHKK